MLLPILSLRLERGNDKDGLRLPVRVPRRALRPSHLGEGVDSFVANLLEIALTAPRHVSKLTDMVVHLKPETESRLRELAATTGREPDELVEDAMTGYLTELTQVRKMLDGRYDEIKSGRVQAIDGEKAFVQLRQKIQDRRSS